MNPDIIKKIQSLGQKYGLHIDEIGLILNEVNNVLSRKTSRDEFIEKLIDGLDNQSTETVLAIATDVSLEVFNSIRNTLKKPDITPTEKISDREDLLSAIENPAPSEHPISIAQPKPVEKTRPSSEATDVAHAFIGEKLSAPVSLPSQKVVVPPTNIVTKPKPSIDPYREPLN